MKTMFYRVIRIIQRCPSIGEININNIIDEVKGMEDECTILTFFALLPQMDQVQEAIKVSLALNKLNSVYFFMIHFRIIFGRLQHSLWCPRS
jgi:hypothetical protein